MHARAQRLLGARTTAGTPSRTARVVVVLAALSYTTTVRIASAGINVWTSGGPAGASITSLAVDPTTAGTVYAGGTDVFKSTDAGASWHASASGLPSYVNVLTIDPHTPSTLYAGTDSGVFKSIDSGVTWNAMNTGLTYLYVEALVIDPHSPSTLYAATSDCSQPLCQADLFKSSDGAESWHPSSSGLPADPFVENLAFDLLTPGTLYAAATVGTFISTDGGGSWSLRSTQSGSLAFAIDPHTPSIFYAGVAGAGVIKSTDAGSTWDVINPRNGSYTVVQALAIDPTGPGRLYAGTTYDSQAVFKSTDGGMSWMNTGLPYANGLRALAIALTTPPTVYAATGNGVFAIQMATFTVNSVDDAPDAMPGDGVCATAAGVCTLRSAVDEANALPGGSTIEVPAGTYLLTRGVFAINVDLILKGAGAASTRIDGGGASPVLDVAGGTVTVSGVTIQNGNTSGDCGGIMNRGDLTLTNVTVSGNSAHVIGGGICNDGRLTLTNSTVRDNTLLNNCCPAFGGGISNQGDATLTNVVITNNVASGPYSGGGTGGGIQNGQGATLAITGGTISGNTCDGTGNSGGGIHNEGDATVSQAVISGNTADSGAGMGNSGRLTLTTSTVSGNIAPSIGGGLFNEAPATLTLTESTVSGNTARQGGGMYNFGSATLTNVTISDNMAAEIGGGIISAGSATLSNVTVSGNSNEGIHGIDDGSMVQLKNTLVATNTGGNCAGLIFSLGNNLSSDDTCPFELRNIDPKLGPLQDNGGFTLTHALLPGSPAIDAGDDAVIGPPLNLTTDQRGLPRKAGLHVDIGAYEVQVCVGDCNENGIVTVNELLTMVNIALGNAPVTDCQAGDSNHDLHITIDEILAAVGNALNGCPAS